MNKYLLFIDTEASGLPGNWTLPYSTDDNWPHIVQIAWLIYDEHRNLVKEQNRYISADGVIITDAAIATHGITPDFLLSHGEPLDKVMEMLANDLVEFEPTIIGHFMQLDYYLMGAAFYRSGVFNPLSKLPVFCTMVATTQLLRSPSTRQLRLGDLYYMLFKADLQNQHNALHDAQATAESFFELRTRGEISEASIVQQNKDFELQREPKKKPSGCLLPALIVILLLLFAIYLL
ncbi:exonuclease domain-containing protein [Mucilaginibacter calamicampi]|uniref:Exonuclease domain-containing protein n=1 Tax=Mucilaginibacter calamicampi TaxID=1302352 RepID=A0ABW2YUV0_9SPHI